MTSMTEQLTGTQRIAEHARTVAAFLDTLPADIETPTHVNVSHYRTQPQVEWLIFGEGQENQRERAAAIIRAVGGKWDKEPGDLFSFVSERGGVELDITVKRDAVCERVVTGTREVTKTVPAPDAPMVEVTETVEDVEWVCAPLLAEATS